VNLPMIRKPLTRLVSLVCFVAAAIATPMTVRPEVNAPLVDPQTAEQSPNQSIAKGSGPDRRPFLIRTVRIFDGERVIAANSIVVKDGVIKQVGKDLPAPPGGYVIDGAGDTLLPGLIDAHTHTWSRNFLKEALVFGVTTELDMFTEFHFAAAVKKEQAEGRALDLADFKSSGTLVTAPGGHGTEYGMKIPTITAPEQAQEFVDARIAEGSDYIKIIYEDGSAFGGHVPNISKQTMAAVVVAAHKRGKLAVAHIGAYQGALDAINAGVDGLMHLFGDRPPEPDFGRLAADHHAFVVPTLTVLESVGGGKGGASLITDPQLAPYLAGPDIASLKMSFPKRPGAERTLPNAFEAIRELKVAHVPILAGTDAPNPGTWHGVSMHREIELLVQAGLSPAEALTAATSAVAHAFRMPDRGRIATGLRADLLLVKGDPRTDIKATRSIVEVWKAGARADRAAYLAGIENAKAADKLPPPGSESGLVSDFEDGTANTRFGRPWENSTSRKSTVDIKVVDGGAQDSKRSLLIAGEIVPDSGFTWAGAYFGAAKEQYAPVNLSSKKALSFWAKGEGKTYRIILAAQSLGTQPAIQTFVAGPEWKEFRFPLSVFGTDCHDITGIIFSGGPDAGPFSFQIDNVRFEQQF
jgi:imidazolonepropionase-like amidohydrolase